MIRFTWRSLLGDGRRTLTTTAAVLVAVALVVGTLTFLSALDRAYRELFGGLSSGAQLVVTSRADPISGLSAPASISTVTLRRVRRVPGVGVAEGQIQDRATILSADGRALSGGHAPTLALSYLPPPLGSVRFASGRRPRGPDEVAVDAGTALQQRLKVGDALQVATLQAARPFRISGLTQVTGGPTGGARVLTFSLITARALYGKEGTVDAVYLRAVRGVSSGALAARLRPVLPGQLVVQGAQHQIDQEVRGAGIGLRTVHDGLIALAAVGALAGLLLVLGAVSVSGAQRTRQFALLRALGAGRRQVLVAVLAGAAATGLPAALGGMGAGLGVAEGVRAVLVAAGLRLPSLHAALSAQTVLIALALGVLGPAVAALPAARRAMRATPLAALSAGASEPEARATSRGLRGVASVLAALSRPLTRRGDPIDRLATESLARHPGRALAAASSLAVGLALVVSLSAYVAGTRRAGDRALDRTLTGDFTIESSDGVGQIPAVSVRGAVLAPGVAAVAALKSASGRVGRTRVQVNGIDPTTFPLVYRFNWRDGSAATVNNLAPGQALLEARTAQATHLRTGDRTTLVTETGVRVRLRVAGVLTDRALLTGATISRVSFDAVFQQPRLRAVFVKLLPDADRYAAESSLAASLAGLPGVSVRSEAAVKGELHRQTDGLVVLLTALLAVSALLSTLALSQMLLLSVQEQTRELGLLRALGATPAQTRRMVRRGSFVVAVLGTALGVGLGLALSWLVSQSARAGALPYSVPWPTLVACLLLGPLTGVLAALAPAARAGRLDVLVAISHD